MRPPPPIGRAYNYPLTAGISLLAIAVTLALAAHYDISPFLGDPVYLLAQPWRLLASTLPHGNLFHLGFNLYWFWVFGTFLEKHLGLARYGAILILLAAGSGAAELAVFEGGIGLSGVVYGLFGILWIMGRRDPAFADLVDSRTAGLFIAWFFLCVLLTVLNVLQIANVAHAAGLLLGLILGEFLMVPRRRTVALLALVSTLVLIILAATIARPWVNLGDGGAAFSYAGYQALRQNDFPRAVALYEQATRYRHVAPGSWFNLGIAYQNLHRYPDALAAYQHAHILEPNNPDFESAIRNLQAAP